MSDVDQNVKVPQNANAIAQALQKVVLDVIAAKKQGLTGVQLEVAIGTTVFSDLASALPDLAGLGQEISSELVGVAEAFTIAGFGVLRSLSGK